MERQKRGLDLQYPVGPSANATLLRFLDRVLRLDAVTKIQLSPGGIFLERSVSDEEDVLPPGLQEMLQGDPAWPGADFMLKRVTLRDCTVQAPDNPMLGWNAALLDLEADGTAPCAVLAPTGDYFDAYFGLPEGTEVSRWLGLAVFRAAEIEPGKLVFLGSPTGVVLDATHGIVFDTGVMG